MVTGKGRKEMTRGGSECMGKGRGPVVEWGRVVRREVKVDIGSKEMELGGDPTSTKNGALGLAVAKTGKERVGGRGEGGGGRGEKGGSKRVTTNGLAKEVGTRGKFWVGVSGIGLEELESSKEMGTIGGGEGGERRTAGGGGEYFGFVEVETDANRGTKRLKAFEKPKKVGVNEEGLRIIIVRAGMGKGAKAVVIERGGAASECASMELVIDRANDEKQDKAGKDGA